MTNLDATITRLDKRRRQFRIGSLSFIAIHSAVAVLCIAALTLSLARADAHYARMAKVNQERLVSWNN
jgi:hypothetical protein